MFFTVVNRFGDYPLNAKDQVYLTWDDWNDFSFRTLFGIFYVDGRSEKHDLGNVKIAHYGQDETQKALQIGDSFDALPSDCFSLGVDVEYYEKLNELGDNIRDRILLGLHDIAKNENFFEKAINENVTKVSFLRGISETSIVGQFRRLAMGGSKLTSYHFEYSSPIINGKKPMILTFQVEPESIPPTNLHVLIGRNGVGKTFLINNMIDSLIKVDGENMFGKFRSLKEEETTLFANLTCITFSAFDEFQHPPEQRDKSLGIQYSYIGLKETEQKDTLKRPKAPRVLRDEFIKSMISCKNNSRIGRWQRAIDMLSSDPIFRDANISALMNLENLEKFEKDATKLFKKLSSGHKIVLLTITRLVETLEDRSLILIDEPESHLHPPLLSSFNRVLSDLLINRNGVSIIATHSPVVLQEVPKECIWKLRRIGAEAKVDRLEIESFGENVGILTQEIFGLEVTDSGFHKILKELVEKSESYEDAVAKLKGQIGLEGKAILRSLFYQKTKSV